MVGAHAKLEGHGFHPFHPCCRFGSIDSTLWSAYIVRPTPGGLPVSKFTKDFESLVQMWQTS